MSTRARLAATAAWVLCLTAGTAAGQERAQIDVKGRLKGTTEWLDTIDFLGTDPSQRAEVEIAVFYWWSARNGDTAMATCVSSPVVLGWDTAFDAATLLDRSDSTQHPDGRQGNFNFGGQHQATYTGGVNDMGRLRIAAPNNTQANPAGGVSVKQNTPIALGTNLDTSNPALGFRFDLAVSCNDLDASTIRTLIGTVPLNLVNSYNVYNDPGAASTDDQHPILLDTDPLTMTFNWIPSPATLGPVSLAGIAGLRRRRAALGASGRA